VAIGFTEKEYPEHSFKLPPVWKSWRLSQVVANGSLDELCLGHPFESGTPFDSRKKLVVRPKATGCRHKVPSPKANGSSVLVNGVNGTGKCEVSPRTFSVYGVYPFFAPDGGEVSK
jgi:hypothetical protein